jgi:hypothetical protein
VNIIGKITSLDYFSMQNYYYSPFNSNNALKTYYETYVTSDSEDYFGEWNTLTDGSKIFLELLYAVTNELFSFSYICDKPPEPEPEPEPEPQPEPEPEPEELTDIFMLSNIVEYIDKLDNQGGDSERIYDENNLTSYVSRISESDEDYYYEKILLRNTNSFNSNLTLGYTDFNIKFANVDGMSLHGFYIVVGGGGASQQNFDDTRTNDGGPGGGGGETLTNINFEKYNYNSEHAYSNKTENLESQTPYEFSSYEYTIRVGGGGNYNSNSTQSDPGYNGKSSYIKITGETDENAIFTAEGGKTGTHPIQTISLGTEEYWYYPNAHIPNHPYQNARYKRYRPISADKIDLGGRGGLGGGQGNSGCGGSGGEGSSLVHSDLPNSSNTSSTVQNRFKGDAGVKLKGEIEDNKEFIITDSWANKYYGWGGPGGKGRVNYRYNQSYWRGYKSGNEDASYYGGENPPNYLYNNTGGGGRGRPYSYNNNHNNITESDHYPKHGIVVLYIIRSYKFTLEIVMNNYIYSDLNASQETTLKTNLKNTLSSVSNINISSTNIHSVDLSASGNGMKIVWNLQFFKKSQYDNADFSQLSNYPGFTNNALIDGFYLKDSSGIVVTDKNVPNV